MAGLSEAKAKRAGPPMRVSLAPTMLQCNIQTQSKLGATLQNHENPVPDHPRSRFMLCTIQWLPESGMAFSAETESGHLLTMDGAPEGGGRNLAPRPMETVLAGAGGCSAYDVVLILQRGRHEVRGCRVTLQAERADRDPKVFTKIHMHFIVSGRALPLAAVERAVALSHERYCSASIMLGKSAEISTSVEIVEI